MQLYNVRTIDGQPAPVPRKVVATRETLEKETYTSASGKRIRNIVAEKMRFDLTFPPMQKAELQSIIALLDNDKLTITYENVVTGAIETGEFYRNDISITPIWIKNKANTNVIYDVFSISLIEY